MSRFRNDSALAAHWLGSVATYHERSAAGHGFAGRPRRFGCARRSGRALGVEEHGGSEQLSAAEQALIPVQLASLREPRPFHEL
jgi:hypothetical protein